MKFIRADADFRAQAQFVAVVEARAGVDQHRRRIDAGVNRRAAVRSLVTMASVWREP